MVRPTEANSKVFDAIVVGSGLAGLTAGLELLARGLSVVLVEKTDRLGGNSAKASSGINGVPTRFQNRSEGDSAEIFARDTLRSGKSLSSPGLVDILTQNSGDAIRWLTEENQIDLSLVTILGGHTHARTHRGSGKLPPGFAIVSALSKKIRESPLVDIRTQSELVKFVTKNKKVVGVEVKNLSSSDVIYGRNVILATGGYSADFSTSSSLLKRFRPDLMKLPLTNGQQTTGDGQKIAERDLGARLIHMDKIQVHPTGFIQLKDQSTAGQKWKFLCGELIRGIGGVLFSPITGNRFVDELRTRDEVTGAIVEHCTAREDQVAVAAIVVGEEDYLKAKSHIDFYLSQQVMFRGTVADVVEKFAQVGYTVSGDTLRENIQHYNEQKRKVDEFARLHVGNDIGTTFFFGLVTPVLHFSMGGIEINTLGQVVTDNGVHENVFAIGEVSGGVHGENRLGGSSLLECVVFGRRVAQQIAE